VVSAISSRRCSRARSFPLRTSNAELPSGSFQSGARRRTSPCRARERCMARSGRCPRSGAVLVRPLPQTSEPSSTNCFFTADSSVQEQHAQWLTQRTRRKLELAVCPSSNSKTGLAGESEIGRQERHFGHGPSLSSISNEFLMNSGKLFVHKMGKLCKVLDTSWWVMCAMFYYI
jgi:hypothetical protein